MSRGAGLPAVAVGFSDRVPRGPGTGLRLGVAEAEGPTGCRLSGRPCWEREPITLGRLARVGVNRDRSGAGGLDGLIALVYYYSSTVWRAQ